MTDQFWLWIGFVCMAAGSAAILLKGGHTTPEKQTAATLHGIVPAIAACFYLAMVVGQGSITLASAVAGGTDHDSCFAHCIDWPFTTFILLGSLTLTFMHGRLPRWGLLTGAVLSDVLMIVTVSFFGLLATVKHGTGVERNMRNGAGSGFTTSVC